AHTGTVSVEDSHDLRIQRVMSMVSHGNGLGKTFSFIVYASRADRIDIPPIVLVLGMDQGITIAFRGRSQNEDGILLFFQLKGVMSPQRSYLQSWDGKLAIVDRTSR